MDSIRRTCGSVRSRLTATARLVTAWSDSCRDNVFNPGGFEWDREAALLVASVRPPEHRRDGMFNRKVTANHASLSRTSPRTITGLSQKAMQPDGPLKFRATRTSKAAGVMAGANPSVSSSRNMVNPMPSSQRGQRTVRGANGAVDMGCWNKPRLPRNGADKHLDWPSAPRKRADFQRVITDERVGRITE